MRRGLIARVTALTCSALLIALCAGCGGGGGDSGSGGSAASSNAAPPATGNTGIGAGGGTVSEASGAKVVVPAGALTSDTAIAVTQSSAGAPALPAGLTTFGPTYAFTPHGTAFAVPVTITVPFNPASVPAGTTLALYKTNATQTAWDVVSGATVNGNTMVGNVGGFSFAMVAAITPTLKSWQAEAFTEDGNQVTLVQDQNHGEVVHIRQQVGDPQTFVLFGTPETVPEIEIESNESGRTFWTAAIAPHNRQSESTRFNGIRNSLTQTFFFEVQQDNPTLSFVITDVQLDSIDEGGRPAGRETCPWLPANSTPERVLTSCNPHMSLAEASFDIEASSLVDQGIFFTSGGTVRVTGLHGDWRPDVFGSGQHALWSKDDFDLDADPNDDESQRQFRVTLHRDFEIPPNPFDPVKDKTRKIGRVPISHLHKGDVFRVAVTVTTTAVNRIQGESYIDAYLRDPLQESGLDSGLQFETTGLTQLPARDDIPTSAPVLSCTTGVDPAAGVLQFVSSTFADPELSGNAEVIIERAGGTAGAVSVRVATHDATATATSDYEAVSTEVRFADGEGGQRRVKVPLVNDSVAEDDETVDLALSDVGGCGALGAQPTATLTILDDDRPLPPPETHTVGGTVSGLTGSGLVLRDVLTGTSVAASNGPFTLPDARVDGTHYDVRVDTQPGNPVNQCTVANGSGAIAGADITNVQVTCASLAPSGSLDPTFGSSGRAITTIAFSANIVDARIGMALQGDGRILLVGGLTLLRFNSDGSLDTTFGTGGQVHVPFDGSVFDTAQDVAVQPDGKIVVVGFTNVTGFNDNFALVRFNTDGTLDTTFGTAGKTSTDFAASQDQARRVKIQPDGKILVTGFATQVVSPTVAAVDFALARYNADGNLDTSFANGGKARDSAGRSFNKARGLAIQSDGKIVLAGTTSDNGVDAPTEVGLVRYLGDVGLGLPGQRDNAFGEIGNGTVDSNLHLATSSLAEDLVVTADGTVIAAGRVAVGAAAGGTDYGFVLASFSGDGRQKSGALITKFSNQSDTANSMLLQADGKIVVVGQSANLGSNPDMAIVRYDASSSSPDASFGTDGKLTLDFFGGRDSAQVVVQQPDGKLVVGGFAQSAGKIVFALARLAP